MSSDEETRLLPPASDLNIAHAADLLGAARRMIDLGFFEEAMRLCQEAVACGGAGAIEAFTVMLEIVSAETAARRPREANYGELEMVAAPLEAAEGEYLSNISHGGSLDEISAPGLPARAAPGALGRPLPAPSIEEIPVFLRRHDLEWAGVEEFRSFENMYTSAGASGSPGQRWMRLAEDPEVLVRTPHLDVSPRGPLAPGSTVALTLRLDGRAFGAGESGEHVEAPDGAVLKIRLATTAHFTLGQKELSLTLDARQATQHADAVLVGVHRLEEMEGLGAPAISAQFFARGRPCGRVQKSLRITGFKPGRRGTARARVPPRVAVNGGAALADLTITITASPANDGQAFECVISSPLLPELAGGVAGPWNLQQKASDIVAREMADFTTRLTGSADEKRERRIASLRGAGIAFYQGSPRIFRRVYRLLRSRKLAPKHIAIISDEPHIPWELMVPFERRKGIRVTEPPLGVQYAIGRWITDDGVAARQKLTLSDSSVFAPAYAGSRVLPHAVEEARMVIEKFAPGRAVEPADFSGFADMLRSSLGSVLHLACHGKDDRHMQALELVDGSELTSSQLSGLIGIEEAFGTRRPFVFLNACEVGRQEPALAGVRGFAKEFIALGASAVIAPLWSVKDTLAHEVAKAFYSAVDAGRPVPFAEILSRLRAGAYDPAIGEDTYAAYCFYGDPLATI